MNITFDELRKLKHSLPHGSVERIAKELEIEEETVRHYFGGDHFEEGQPVDIHIEPGPNGGIVNLGDSKIYDLAVKIVSEANSEN